REKTEKQKHKIGPDCSRRLQPATSAVAGSTQPQAEACDYKAATRKAICGLSPGAFFTLSFVASRDNSWRAGRSGCRIAKYYQRCHDAATLFSPGHDPCRAGVGR